MLFDFLMDRYILTDLQIRQNNRFDMDRFGPLGAEQKTSFVDESLSSTRRADIGIDDFATRPDEDNGNDLQDDDDDLASRNEVSQTRVTGTTTTTTITTTTTAATTTTSTTTMPSKGSELQKQKLHLTPPDVNHIPFRVAPQSQVWPHDTDSKKHQGYHDDEDYYYEAEYHKDDKKERDNRLKVTNIDEALEYFSRERLRYKAPPEENSLGPAVPLYSLKRNKDGKHQVRVESYAAGQIAGIERRREADKLGGANLKQVQPPSIPRPVLGFPIQVNFVELNKHETEI